MIMSGQVGFRGGRWRVGAATALMATLVVSTSGAQTADPGPPPETAASAPDSAPAEDSADDTGISRVEPDFTLVNVPTALRLPVHGSAFRVTHRFTRRLNEGDFGSLLENFFGFDGGARIGLEYRFGLARGVQAGIYRTSDRTIQFFGQYDAIRQGRGLPVGVAVHVSIDGTNNFRDEYSPGLGVVVSRTAGDWLALYAEPAWLGNTDPTGGAGPDRDTFVVSFGGRVRMRPSVYGVVEVTPRVSGFAPRDPEVAFAVEKRLGGHVFQLNVSNTIATTLAGTLKTGGADTDSWYIGFNISRKFY